MPQYLVFTLGATIGAMGELAGHERRGTETWPGRSAILGLVGAAMGIPRGGDFEQLDRLGLAVAVFDIGAPLRDYHTVETVPSAATRSLKRSPHSRAEALAVAGRQGTSITLTSRDYRTGVAYGVALWGDDLERVVKALTYPAFPLYLGRRSCPLSAPLAPRKVTARTAEEAIASAQLPPWLLGSTAGTLYTEDLTGSHQRIESRRDAPLDRAARHFGPRQVAVKSVHISPVGQA